MFQFDSTWIQYVYKNGSSSFVSARYTSFNLSIMIISKKEDKNFDISNLFELDYFNIEM